MHMNENTKIIGEKVILVPYEADHVEKYHRWMQSAELQELTASEPLSLEEEYAMQRSWRTDEDKCTFLVLCRQTFNRTGNEIAALVGDTNIFLGKDVNTGERVAEVEIMIAEINARGKGYGWEAMLLMLKYAQQHLGIEKYEAKIGMDNANSLRLFKKMQFEEVARAEVFREVTLARPLTDAWVQWLDEQLNTPAQIRDVRFNTVAVERAHNEH